MRQADGGIRTVTDGPGNDLVSVTVSGMPSMSSS